MRLLALLILVSCSLPPGSAAADPPLLVPLLQRLQGAWEEVIVGDASATRYTAEFTGSAFYFHRDTNFWFRTSVELRPQPEPVRMQATIQQAARGQENALGKVVVAILKLEGDVLTLAARWDGSEETPPGFDKTDDKGLTEYRLQRRKPQKPAAAAP